MEKATEKELRVQAAGIGFMCGALFGMVVTPLALSFLYKAATGERPYVTTASQCQAKEPSHD